LHLGDNGDRLATQSGRIEMDQERWVDHALKILGVAAEVGAPLTHAQRKRFAELALRPVFSKRHNALWDGHGAGEIELDQAKQLHRKIWEQFEADVEALAAARPGRLP
jgi:hypothetical protein